MSDSGSSYSMFPTGPADDWARCPHGDTPHECDDCSAYLRLGSDSDAQ